MEVVVAEALKPSLRTESIFQQTICEEILCLNANNVVAGEDFSVDDLLDFSNGEFQHGSVGKEVDVCEEEEEEEHEKNSTTSGSEHERTEDDDNSNSTTFSGAGDGESNSIFAGGLAVPADDVADLEWVSHFVDDSIPELSLLYPVQARSEPEPRPGPTNAYSQLSIIRRKPRTTKTRRPNCNVWIFNPILYSAKKQRKKPEAQTGGAHFQRRCSHCHVQKTPQWRAGPLGPKTLCNACGVRFKSGRLFPEYRPACSPTFSGEIHSNSHRKVLEMRRRKEVDEPVSGLNRIQMVTSW
uniref:GATA transcription factor n=1 Tax=Medicago truncatula TaxID=3880 RepID=I3T1U1_MEDTR|nr:unknown [Medicago truncatula]